jgi:hypothetical protein
LRVSARLDEPEGPGVDAGADLRRHGRGVGVVVAEDVGR